MSASSENKTDIMDEYRACEWLFFLYLSFLLWHYDYDDDGDHDDYDDDDHDYDDNGDVDNNKNQIKKTTNVKVEIEEKVFFFSNTKSLKLNCE